MLAEVRLGGLQAGESDVGLAGRLPNEVEVEGEASRGEIMTGGSGFFGLPSYGRIASPEELTPQQRVGREIAALKAQVEGLEGEVKRLAKQPSVIAPVVWVTADEIEVRLDGAFYVVDKPRHLAIREGDCVRTDSKKGGILEVIPFERLSGVIATVKHVHSGGAQVETDNPEKLLRTGAKLVGVKAGDRVLVDLTGSIAIHNFGPAATNLHFTGETGVSWDDIGGQAEAKRCLREAIEEPYTHAALYKRFRKKGVKGILLYGPPGCGKSLFGKAAATALATLHGAQAKATGFVFVRGPEILDKYVGNSESNVRSIFDSARLHHEREGYPALVFIDEADAILGARGRGSFEGIEKTIVPQFLAEMDGIEDSGALVILATNRPDTLDPAVVREGRIDRKVHVTRPTREEGVEILRRALKGKPLEEGATPEWAAGEAFERIGAENVSGALLVGLVERTTQLAIRRAIDTGGMDGVITRADVTLAARQIVSETRDAERAKPLEKTADAPRRIL